jgi:hypothetical protein
MKRSALGIGVVCQDNETAIARGDRLWADSAFDHALAEYRLAVRAAGRRPGAGPAGPRLRPGGAVPRDGGPVPGAAPGNPGLVDQAVYDYLYVAERASRRGDTYTAAVALDDAIQP